MAKKVLTYLLIFGIIGLIAGYFIYGKVAGEYLNPIDLLLPAKNGLHELGRAVGGIQSIRNNIFMFGGIGAVLGIVIAILRKK